VIRYHSVPSAVPNFTLIRELCRPWRQKTA